MFKLGEQTNDSAPDKNNSAPPESNTGGLANASRAAASEETQSLLAAKPKRKYTRRNNPEGGDDQRALQTQVSAAIAAQLESLYDPAAIGALCGLPADAALALTGKEHWKIGDKERAALGASGSALLRTLMITNPRGLALFLFGGAVLSVYMPRVVTEIKDWQKEKAEKTKALKDAGAKTS